MEVIQLGISLKAARVNKNLTQAEAAEKLNVSKYTIGNWERGISFPDVEHIKKIEELYDVPYNDINFLN